MKIGYNTWAIPRLPYDTILPALRRIGYTAVALTVVPGYTINGEWVRNETDVDLLDSTARKRIGALCDELGLELHSVVGNQNIIGGDDEQTQRAMQRLRETIDFCADVTPPGPGQPRQAVPVLCTGSGGRAGDFETHKDVLVERLGQLGDYAGRRGVTIALEPHVNDPLERPEHAEWVIRQVGSPYVRLDLDMSHFMVQGYPLEEVVPRLAPLAVSTEIKDQRIRPLDEPEPEGWGVPGNGSGRSTSPDGRALEFQFLLGGEGDFDLPKYLRLMRQAGWDGPVCFEASLACVRRPGYDPIASATETYRWMARGWEAAGVPRD
jgi:sugar phosphate isomerase/epimerase